MTFYRSSRQTPKRSRALLPSLTPTFSAPARHCTGLLSRHRHLQLRGPILLITRTPLAATSLPLSSDKALPLTSHHLPQVAGERDATLYPNHRFTFATTDLRDRFLAACLVAASSAASPTAAASRYRLLRVLARGASGPTYLARRNADGRILALKTIAKADVFFTPAALANLVAERTALVEAAARGAPFAVQLVDAFETSAHLCFVTELAAFGDLGGVQEQLPGRRVPEAVARRLFADVVLGLEDTHRMGFLYRDMKPGNLLLTRSGHVRVADFGLAKRLGVEVETSSVSSESGGDAEDSSSSDEDFQLVGRATSFVGTRRFMSPEQLRGGTVGATGYGMSRGYGAAADLWALGVTLYVLLVGRYPFGARISSRDTVSIYHAIQYEKLTFPEWLSAEAVELLKGLLNRDGRQRFEMRDVKECMWMRGVEWDKVREDAAKDVEVAEVLDMVRKHGVRKVETVMEEEKGKQVVDENLCSVLTGSDDGRRSGGNGKFKRRGVRKAELLGFGLSIPQ